MATATMRVRRAAAVLAVAALVAASGCGESETAAPAKQDGGKATSTPAKKKDAPGGY
jgi:hypothetical protein